MKLIKRFRLAGLLALLTFILALAPTLHLALPGLAQTPSAQSEAFAGNPTLQAMAEADRLFLAQNFEAAEKLYRQVKPPMTLDKPSKPPQLVFEPSQLDGSASVYWREAKEGIAMNLEDKTFIALQLLTDNYPDFIPAHLELARVCQQNPTGCKRVAKPGQPDHAIAVLERASFLYLDQTDLLDARIATFGQEERWLEASIAARQFALTFPKHPQAPKYSELAKTNLKRYEEVINQKLQGNIIATVAVSLLTGDKSGADLIRLLLQGEAKVGEQLAELRKKEYAAKNQLVTDPEVLEPINRVGQKLAKLMGRDEFTYEFNVVRDPQINAFALPGGKIFVNTGLLQNLRSESELAGILSHEIAHSVLSHGFQKMAESATIANIGRIIPFGKLVQDGASAAGSREQERQADILGTRVLANAEYAADGLRNVLVLFRERDRGDTNWLSSHPAPAERVLYVENLILRNGFNRFAYEGVLNMANLNNRLQGLPPAQYAGQPGIPSGVSALANPSANSTSPALPSPSPRLVTPSPAGQPQISARLERDRVTVTLDQVELKRNRSYTVGFSIENQSDRPVFIVRNFIEVRNLDDEPIGIIASLAPGAEAGIAPGSTLRGQIQILDLKYRWKNTPSQGLTLFIKEGSTGGRVFRIPF